MTKYCTMLVNQRSSRFDKKKIDACFKLIKEKGYLPKLILTTEKKDEFVEDFKEKGKKANEESDLVITYGGDGFFGLYQDVINGQQHALTSHAPMGTADDMALNLGMPKDIVTATNEILNGEIGERDIITSNGRAFGYVSCFGIFTNIPFDTPIILKKMGPAGYLVAAVTDIVKLLTGLAPIHTVNYTVNGREYQTDCLIGIVSNAYGFAGVQMYNETKQDDGKFETLLVKPEVIKKAPKLIANFKQALGEGKNVNLDILKHYPNEIKTFSTDNITFHFKNSEIKFDNDGDRGPDLDQEKNITYRAAGKCKILFPKKIRQS